MNSFRALRIHDEGAGNARIEELPLRPPGKNEVQISVAYSGINYKDALAVLGEATILRHYPLTAGIDLGGFVTESNSADFRAGDAVLAQGTGLSETRDGGFADYATLPAECVVGMPEGLDVRSAMLIGTAGFTAALAIGKMEKNGQTPEQGEVLVTGASGGVGSFAVNLLALKGYDCLAATRKAQAHEFLTRLGAKRIRPPLDATPKLLGKSLWAGAVDNLGGDTLATAVKCTRPWGNVVSIGLAQSPMLCLTTHPFILRGVNLLGVSSANCPLTLRQHTWSLLGNDMHPTHLDQFCHSEIDLDTVLPAAKLLLQGKVTGRILVKL